MSCSILEQPNRGNSPSRSVFPFSLFHGARSARVATQHKPARALSSRATPLHGLLSCLRSPVPAVSFGSASRSQLARCCYGRFPNFGRCEGFDPCRVPGPNPRCVDCLLFSEGSSGNSTIWRSERSSKTVGGQV